MNPGSSPLLLGKMGCFAAKPVHFQGFCSQPLCTGECVVQLGWQVSYCTHIVCSFLSRKLSSMRAEARGCVRPLCTGERAVQLGWQVSYCTHILCSFKETKLHEGRGQGLCSAPLHWRACRPARMASFLLHTHIVLFSFKEKKLHEGRGQGLCFLCPQDVFTKLGPLVCSHTFTECIHRDARRCVNCING